MTAIKDLPLREAMREHRIDQGVTQTAIARRLRETGVKGASQTALSQIETGDKPLVDLSVPTRLRVLQEYGFNMDEIRELNQLHDLELEYVLPGAGQAATQHDPTRVRVVGRVGREFALVPRRTLQQRPEDAVAVFDAPDKALVDTRVARALRAGAQFVLDTSMHATPGAISIYKLAHGGWAAFVERDDERPIAVEAVDGDAVAILQPADLGEFVGVVFHTDIPAEGLLGLLGP